MRVSAKSLSYKIYSNLLNSQIELMLHQGKIEEALEADGVFLEDSVKLYSEFFINKNVKASMTAVFQFDEKFEPLLKLGYPLLLGTELLNGAIITGHVLEFPSNSVVDRVVLSTRKGILTIILTLHRTIDVSKYKIYSGISEVKKYALELVKQKEAKNGKTDEI